MSEITTDIVKHVAHLARLEVNDDQLTAYTQSLDKILDLANKMQAVNTDDISPMSHPWDLHQPLRADVVTEKNERDTMQKVAPKVMSGLYLVPKVIE